MPTAKIGDITMNYTVHGTGDPVVLIGGYASGYWQSWTKYLPILSAGHQVLAFDSRGSGGTDAPDVPYTVEMMADDTLGLMDHLCVERAHIIGRSLGGCIAQAIALRRPQVVRSLTMTSTFARMGNRGRALVAHWIDTVTELGFPRFFEYLMTYFFSAGFYDSRPEEVRRAIDGLLSASRSVHGFRHTGHAVVTHDVMDRLNAISAPTLLLCGADDLITPASHTREIAGQIPGAEVQIIPEAAHGFLTERPESFNLIVDFLTRHHEIHA
ncbi:MAG TPA: alpha/beta fold hydrolase [Burkholderiales bacterium]|nr:alpha/beta fold hydrolase [Burkholderiales bacterium]